MLVQARINDKTLDFKIENTTLTEEQKKILVPLLQNCWDGMENPDDIEIVFERKISKDFFFSVSFEDTFFASATAKFLRDLELRREERYKLEKQKLFSEREKELEKYSQEDLDFLANITFLVDKALSA
ncbi:MAG: hypothetical protein M0P91_04605 [Sulfuricurvum sp.]|jgi:hypothetical protein|uniref:hypothetical protein n=1 Tax=Sulfuricurvum sp. TaxID=2025608 RepID=UPI0025F05E09|nr:hypothetical protein [Sulfuricurvum sp.]MCK9372456.1 hypothetical protein [Sulfuricurvum sp.]